MTVSYAGFSERVFEFCFNSEYAQRFRALLVGAPDIPTQNKEKELGYDVQFELTQGGGVLAILALQHKVARFVDGTGGKNTIYRKAAGGPYFAFPLNVEQHNTIECAGVGTRRRGLYFYYCAPLFTTRADLSLAFRRRKTLRKSVWIDVRGTGQLGGSEAHSIIYSSKSPYAHIFSNDPRPVARLSPLAATLDIQRGPGLDASTISALHDDLLRAILESRDRAAALRTPDHPVLQRAALQSRYDVAAATEALADLITAETAASVFAIQPPTA